MNLLNIKIALSTLPALFSEKWGKKKMLYKILRVHQTKIFGLEMAQDVCYAEIKAIRNEERELTVKIKEATEVMKEKYPEDTKDIDILEMEIEAFLLSEMAQDKKQANELSEKVKKVEEIIKIRNPKIDIGLLDKEVRGLCGLKNQLKTIPNRIQGQEMNIKGTLEDVQRNLKTIDLIKESIAKL